MSSNAVAWGPIRVQTPLQPGQHSGRTRATVPQMARDQHGPRFPCGFLRESCLVKLKPEAEVPLPLPSACEVPWGQKELQHQSLLMASAPDQFSLINKGTLGLILQTISLYGRTNIWSCWPCLAILSRWAED